MRTTNRRVLLAYFLWLLLAALLAYVAWTLHAAVVSLVTMWIDTATNRPFGWTSESVQPFSRLSIFIIGSAGLIYGLWLENRLQRAAREENLWVLAARTLVVLLITLGVCLLLLRL